MVTVWGEMRKEPNKPHQTNKAGKGKKEKLKPINCQGRKQVAEIDPNKYK